VLDPAQNGTFVDHYLEVPFDLSGVMFIATANSLAPIPDRCSTDGSDHLAGVHARREAGDRQALSPTAPAEGDGAPDRAGEHRRWGARAADRGNTREAGVRQLEREIQGVLRKAALEVVEGRAATIKVTAKNLESSPASRRSRARWRTQSGGGGGHRLAWTPVGGDIMFIEAIQMPGKGQITLTGQLGDVMKSPPRRRGVCCGRGGAARDSAGRVHADDVHLHLPAGACRRTVRRPGSRSRPRWRRCCAAVRRARRGDGRRAHAAGAHPPDRRLKEKLTAAARAGVKTVLVPARNQNDIIDVPAGLKKLLDIKPWRRSTRCSSWRCSSRTVAAPRGAGSDVGQTEARPWSGLRDGFYEAFQRIGRRTPISRARLSFVLAALEYAQGKLPAARH